MRRGAQKPRDAADAAEEGQRHAIRSSQRRKGVNAVTEVLLLNASFEPLRLVSVKKAIVLLLQEKAEVVEAAEARLRAQHAAFDVPLVIRLVRYVPIPKPSAGRGSRPRPASPA